jgi:hypothetical protein
VYQEGYWLRHRDRWYIDTVREYLDIPAAVQEVKSRTGPQCRLKIVRADLVELITALLESHGWKPRNAQERPYPTGSINDRGFIRAWVELHGSVDIRQAKDRKGNYHPQKRLRVYGNWSMLDEMNNTLCYATGLNPRTLQPTTGKVTKALYFQGSSVSKVIDWLYDGAEIWNPAAKARLVL